MKKNIIDKELLFLLILGLLSFSLSIYFDLLYEYTRAHEDYELDEIIPFFLIFSFIIFIYNFRLLQKQKNSLLKEKQLKEKLQNAEEEIKTLAGLLPICASCKKIKSDEGYWTDVENYISNHSKAQFTHLICPDCLKELYPDYYDDIMNEGHLDNNSY